MMKTKNFSARCAAAGAVLLVVFASGCATTPPPKPKPDPDKNTIHVPPGENGVDPKDGPVHRRRHHRATPPPIRVSEPAPITHPGG